MLASFLRKNYRTLKLASINSLLSIYKNYGQHISIEQLKSIVIVELPVLLSENDLHISYVGVLWSKCLILNVFIQWDLFLKVALKLATLICKSHGPSLVATNILNQVLLLVRSPLLQGLALESSIEFFNAVVAHKQAGLGYNNIVAVRI